MSMTSQDEAAGHLSGQNGAAVSISDASSITTAIPATPDPNADKPVHEAWLLRRDYPLRHTNRKLFFLGINWYYSYSRDVVEWWTKGLASCDNDITALLEDSSTQTQTKHHNLAMDQQIAAMPQDAQWEIQNLLEERETSSSHRHVLRRWEVVGIVERPRRYVAGPVTEKRWWGTKKVLPLEWVLVLRGQTLDRQERIVPFEFEDSWEQRNDLRILKERGEACSQGCCS